jgi:hypothetical protein
MGELLRKLEEERCCSSSMKDRMSVLQQQLCDAQSSAQVDFKMQPLSNQIVLHLVNRQVVTYFSILVSRHVMLGYYVFLPLFSSVTSTA